MIPNTVKIEVIDSKNRILANTTRYRHVRHLLKSGRATIVCRAPFTIKLLYNVDSTKTLTSERARIKEDVKVNTGFYTYIKKHNKNRDLALAIVDAIYSIPEEDRKFYYTFDALMYFTQIYLEQTQKHPIFRYKAYILAVVKNHNESRNAASNTVKPTTNVPRKNKFANHEQRNWNVDELKRLTCDRDNDYKETKDYQAPEYTPQQSHSNLKVANFDQRSEEYWDKAFEEVLRRSYED